MPGLVPKILIDEVWTEFGVRFENTVGNLLLSAEVASPSQRISDVYTLNFSNVISGVSADVVISTPSSVNPFNGLTFSVVLDDTTEHFDLPGIVLVFSSDVQILASPQAVVTIGLPLGVKNAFPPESGSPSDETRIQVTNTGSENAEDCSMRILPVVKRVLIIGTIFEALRPFSEDAVAKLVDGKVMPYVATAVNVTGSGSGTEMDILIDGSPVDIINLSDGTEDVSEELNVIDYYRIANGDLEGVEFKLSQNVTEDDEENILIFEPQFVEIAPDSSGAAGDWGTSDVTLTEEDQADGVITAGGEAYGWYRIVTSEFGNLKSNPYPVEVCLEGTVLESAGWES